MRSLMRPACLFVLIALWAASPASPLRAQDAASGAVSGVAQTPAGVVAGAFEGALADQVAGDPVLDAVYGMRRFVPIFTGPEDGPRRRALLRAIAEADAHGLPAARYGLAGLRAALLEAATETARARAEVALARALLAYGGDLAAGALDPREIARGMVREVRRPDPNALLADFAAAPDPAAWIAGLAPQTDEYARLLRARAELSARVAAPGAPEPLRVAGALRPGAAGPEVRALRDRLAAIGHGVELGPDSDPSLYDGALQAAVAAFQTQSGLNPDAVVGQRTVAALNLGDAERLAAVTVALERERWLNFDRGARHIWVNLADFSAKVIDAGEITFETETVVGAVLREKQTPEFSDLMRYLEVNPDWTVPPGVVRRDYLPTLQEDPTALAHLMLVDADGQPVAREAVDFRAYTARTFPYMLRQPPGDTNALGLVKFMFPNRHAIYLHDTPEKHLFARDSRTYSSGCVRLQDPFGLAHVLLARQSATPEADFRRALDSGRQVRINLKEPVPIHIDYRTAFFGADGVLRFRPDVYGRDRLVHEALLDAGLASRGVDG
jgi:murein L,D-transpeptidase YcbB/YkuD